MVNKSSVRRKNLDLFNKCVELRKQGLSYSEIRKHIYVAKSTLQNWLNFAGLTLTEEHLVIQSKKRFENSHSIGVEASRRIRMSRNLKLRQQFINHNEVNLDNPLFVAGVIAYEAEGAKKNSVKFSNSDYRMILLFIKFLEKYLVLNRLTDIHYRLYIHESRSADLARIINYWSRIISVSGDFIKVTWKHNLVVGRRHNSEYYGQMVLTVVNQKLLVKKLADLSGIIMARYCGVV